MSGNQFRNLFGQCHCEAMIADDPDHLAFGIRHEVRARCQDSQAGTLAGDDRRRGTVGEEGVGNHFTWFGSVVIVQAAKFHGDQQDHRASHRPS